jgi:hypothetical protein
MGDWRSRRQLAGVGVGVWDTEAVAVGEIVDALGDVPAVVPVVLPQAVNPTIASVSNVMFTCQDREARCR